MNDLKEKHRRCLFVNCREEPVEGERICATHGSWMHVTLADKRYRYEKPPPPRGER